MVFGKLRKRKKLYSERDIVRFSKKIDESSGIYFLIKNRRVTYIGRTKNVFRRVGRHLTEQTKDFDSVAYMAVEDQDESLDLEVEYTKALQPLDNRKNNPKYWKYHKSTWSRSTQKRWYPKAYLKLKNGNRVNNKQITKNFSHGEFACKCGCGSGEINKDLVKKLQKVRDDTGIPVDISSGLRCVTHNKNINGSATSSHLKGLASDIIVHDSQHRHKLLMSVMKYFNRIGIASDFIHVDVDEAKITPMVFVYGY